VSIVGGGRMSGNRPDRRASGAGPTDRLRVAVQSSITNQTLGPRPSANCWACSARDPGFHRADLITSADFTAARANAAFGHRMS